MPTQALELVVEALKDPHVRAGHRLDLLLRGRKIVKMKGMVQSSGVAGREKNVRKSIAQKKKKSNAARVGKEEEEVEKKKEEEVEKKKEEEVEKKEEEEVEKKKEVDKRLGKKETKGRVLEGWIEELENDHMNHLRSAPYVIHFFV